MVRARGTDNTVSVSVRSADINKSVSASTNTTNNPVQAINDKSKYYSELARQYSESAFASKELAEQFAEKAKGYVEKVEAVTEQYETEITDLTQDYINELETIIDDAINLIKEFISDGEQTLDNKASTLSSELEQTKDEAIEDIQEVGTINYNNVSSAGTTALNNLLTAKSLAITSIQDEGERQRQSLAGDVESARESARQAKASEEIATEKAGQVETSLGVALGYAVRAENAEANARTSENNAYTYSINASNSESNAQTYMHNAQEASDSAFNSMEYAKISENNAKTSETNSKASENKAKEYADNIETIIANKQDKLTVGNGIDITNNVISTNTQFCITEDMFDLTTTTKTVEPPQAPYNASYGFTNITIHDGLGIEWIEGAVYNFVLNTKVATSTYRNVRVRIGSNGDYKPLMGVSTTIAVGSSVFIKNINSILIYKSTQIGGGALHILYDTNTTYSAMTQAELDTGTATTARTVTAKLLSDNLALKQNTITDLDTIRAGAVLGSTALQSVPSEYITETELSAYHDSTKQDKLTAGTNITIENNVISASGGLAEVSWGGITGTLSSQTDLKNALDGKQDVGDYALKSELPKIAKANTLGLVAGGNWLTVNQTTGKMECGELTKAQYDSALGYTFISKTTLNNVLTGNGYITSSYHDSTKQDVISDLADIRSGASKGATAIQQVKTINNESIVGSGNITISSGAKIDDTTASTTTVYSSSKCEQEFAKADELLNPFNLLDCKYSELEITNASWLIANGEWNSKSIYPNVYEKIESMPSAIDVSEAIVNYYGWSSGGIYLWTKSLTPKKGDLLYYKTNGATGDLRIGDDPVDSYNSANNTITYIQNAYGGRTVTLPRNTNIDFSDSVNLTDYDFGYNPTNETFRLPLKTKTSFVIDEGEENDITYRIWNDGYCEQEGIDSSGSGTKTITFNKSYIDVNYHVLGTTQAGTLQSDNGFSYSILSANSFQAVKKNTSCNWKTSGYLATDQYKPQKLYYYVGATLQNKTSIDVSGVVSELSNKVGTNSPLVANTRFDGQWVEKKIELSSSGSVGTYTFDLSNYLPSDGGNYEIKIGAKWYSSATTYPAVKVYSDLISDYMAEISVGNYNRNETLNITIPVKRYLHLNITAGTITMQSMLSAFAYRRLGTNE